MERIAYLFVLNTMADWETGFLTAELNSGRFFRKDVPRYKVKTVALDKNPVVTMGGITILPDLSLDEVTYSDADLFILPGADTWLEPEYIPVMDKVKEFLNEGVTVAAICGATMAMAQAGLLNHIPHTSNHLEALKAMCPHYLGEALYQNTPVVVSQHLITASGIAPLEFAQTVLGHLEVFPPEALYAWYNLHKEKEAVYYFSLMEAVSPHQEVAES